jgi:hypothetical protein
MGWQKLKEEKITILQTKQALQELAESLSPQNAAPIAFTQQQRDEWYRSEIHWNESKKMKRQIAFEKKCENEMAFITPRGAASAVAFQERLQNPPPPKLKCDACLLRACEEKGHLEDQAGNQLDIRETINDVGNILARRNRSAVLFKQASLT